MNVTMERISRISEVREMLLSFQTCFNLVNAAVVCAILESISGLESTSDTTTGVVCHQLGLLGTDLYAAGCEGFVETLN